MKVGEIYIQQYFEEIKNKVLKEVCPKKIIVFQNKLIANKKRGEYKC